jgi:hypothetical protein
MEKWEIIVYGRVESDRSKSCGDNNGHQSRGVMFNLKHHRQIIVGFRFAKCQGDLPDNPLNFPFRRGLKENTQHIRFEIN